MKVLQIILTLSNESGKRFQYTAYELPNVTQKNLLRPNMKKNFDRTNMNNFEQKRTGLVIMLFDTVIIYLTI